MTPSRLPSCSDIVKNAILQSPATQAKIHEAMKRGLNPAEASWIQSLLQTRPIGRGMRWFLNTVAA